MALIEVVDDHAMTATQQERQQAEQGGHALATKGQGAEQFADRQQQDGDPQRGAIEHDFSSSFAATMTIRYISSRWVEG